MWLPKKEKKLCIGTHIRIYECTDDNPEPGAPHSSNENSGYAHFIPILLLLLRLLVTSIIHGDGCSACNYTVTGFVLPLMRNINSDSAPEM